MRGTGNVRLILFVLAAISLVGLRATAADNAAQPILSAATAFASGRVTGGPPVERYGLQFARAGAPRASVMGAVKRSDVPSGEFNLIYHVLGIGNGFPGFQPAGGAPDTNLAVGDSEVVQWANVSYADFNKSTGAIIPLNGLDFTSGNQIWASLLPGSLCGRDNLGDLLVKFDRAAHRWVLAKTALISPYAVCIAVSQTATFSDNLWYAYQFPVVQSGLPDYAKWGVWSSGGQSDGYFQTFNNFGPGGTSYQGPVMCGYDRAKLLVGDPGAEQICFQLTMNESSLLPADRDSPVGPPAPEDEFFIGSVDAVDNAHLSLYSMHINNWASGSATMTGLNNSQLIAVAPYSGSCSGQFGGACVPQPGGGHLDSLGDRLMYRFAYWDDQPSASVTAAPPIPPPLQHWLVNFDVESPTGQIGVRWFEFIATQRAVRVTFMQVFQQGTYAGSPADTNYRWMGSVARDNVQDILLGYSESSSMLYPSIAVAGRKYGDAQNTLSPEQFAVNGTGSSTSSAWGEYSDMEIDPSDNCTFFYTTEYYMSMATGWSTDISSWKFPNCR
ncbi:MAG TPA: hypothetical protein VL240_03245 [Candidatus Binatia bacterium]|nr:hypothetical protein [Candidatus Binatia bacterium]